MSMTDLFSHSDPMLAGNVAALLSPMVFIPILTYAFGPQRYDWISMKLIRKADDSDVAKAAGVDLESVPGERRQSVIEEEAEQAQLKKAAVIARSMTVFLTLALIILWPMPMYGTGYIFSEKFFTGWVVVGIIWLMCSTMAVGIYPLIEGRHGIAHTFKCMYLDARGRYHPKRSQSQVVETYEGEEGETPTADEKIQTKTG
jgi:hypothetical protein